MKTIQIKKKIGTGGNKQIYAVVLKRKFGCCSKCCEIKPCSTDVRLDKVIT